MVAPVVAGAILCADCIHTTVYGYLQIVNQSAFTALTLADIKSHLNVTSTSDDDYIAGLLAAAVNYVERATGLDLRTTTWKLVLDQFPLWHHWNNPYYLVIYPYYPQWWGNGQLIRQQEISLRRGPLQSITSIQYYDGTTTQTLDPSTYTVVTPSYYPAYIAPTTCWPVAYPSPGAVSINFITGLADPVGHGSGEGNQCPQPLLHAIRLLCGQWYSLREDIAFGPGTAHGATGEAIECLLSSYTANAGVS